MRAFCPMCWQIHQGSGITMLVSLPSDNPKENTKNRKQRQKPPEERWSANAPKERKKEKENQSPEFQIHPLGNLHVNHSRP